MICLMQGISTFTKSKINMRGGDFYFFGVSSLSLILSLLEFELLQQHKL